MVYSFILSEINLHRNLYNTESIKELSAQPHYFLACKIQMEPKLTVASQSGENTLHIAALYL